MYVVNKTHIYRKSSEHQTNDSIIRKEMFLFDWMENWSNVTRFIFLLTDIMHRVSADWYSFIKEKHIPDDDGLDENQNYDNKWFSIHYVISLWMCI